jgi:hypothetical protein
MAKGTIIVNRGTRTYHLMNGPDGESRSIPPGASVEITDEKETKHLLRYHDLHDIKDVAPQTAAKIKAHEAEIERLKAENEKLKSQHRSAGAGSIEEMNEESAGTGFPGPGGPAVPSSTVPVVENEPTHQETATSEEAQEDAERASKSGSKHQATPHRKR